MKKHILKSILKLKLVAVVILAAVACKPVQVEEKTLTNTPGPQSLVGKSYKLKAVEYTDKSPSYAAKDNDLSIVFDSLYHARGKVLCRGVVTDYALSLNWVDDKTLHTNSTFNNQNCPRGTKGQFLDQMYYKILGQYLYLSDLNQTWTTIFVESQARSFDEVDSESLNDESLHDASEVGYEENDEN